MNRVLLLLSLIVSPLGLGDATLADYQQVNENQRIFPYCKEAAGVGRVSLESTSKVRRIISRKGAEWSGPRAKGRHCQNEKTLPKEPACFVVKSFQCLRGRCPEVAVGTDIRKFGIDVTEYNYLPDSRYYLMWNYTSSNPRWGTVPWDIEPALFAKMCR